jgi:hypothetical protein
MSPLKCGYVDLNSGTLMSWKAFGSRYLMMLRSWCSQKTVSQLAEVCIIVNMPFAFQR